MRTAIALLCLALVVPALAQRDTLRTGVDLVVVPVSVKDSDGRFVYGLQRGDFTVIEDGRSQEIVQFSTEPAPLSVAVLLDTGVEGAAMRRMAESLVSLSSAFTEIDEAEIYRFDRFVTKLSDFSNSQESLERSL